jgi:hypothetical protein
MPDMATRPDDRSSGFDRAIASADRQRIWPSMHTTLVAFDINHFGDQRRGTDIQLYLRHVMYELVDEAFSAISPSWRNWHHEDRGDGIFIVAPPCVPAEAFMDPLAHHLLAGIRRRNRLANSVARLQLRMAVHTGQVHHDPHGIAGHAALHLFRLLQAAAFKKAVNDASADLALIVSDHLYADAERSGLIDPDAYQPIRAYSKETRARAWIWLPPVPRRRSPFRPMN